MKVIYEDNHIIVVEKASGDIVQGDKTGDTPLSDTVKAYIKEKYAKPGNVFLGVVHRLDRPVSGLVVFARTSKALSRLNEMFRKGEVHKVYWAFVQGHPEKETATLRDMLIKNEQQNKSYVVKSGRGAKEAVLRYSVIEKYDHYSLLEVELLTGRHHQIRCQLSNAGHPIKGDLKYGARRSNPDGSISLQAHSVSFVHPVSRQQLTFSLPDANPFL